MTVDPPPEDRAGFRRVLPSKWVVLFLAGPVIWYLHFWIVYLAAEAACAAGGPGREVVGVPLLSAFVVVATALAVAMICWLALRSRSDWASSRAPSVGFPPESEAFSGGTEKQSAKPARLSADPVSALRRRGALTRVGAVLGVLFAFATLFVGASAVFLTPC